MIQLYSKNITKIPVRSIGVGFTKGDIGRSYCLAPSELRYIFGIVIENRLIIDVIRDQRATFAQVTIERGRVKLSTHITHMKISSNVLILINVAAGE